jgi:hypothetical protein
MKATINRERKLMLYVTIQLWNVVSLIQESIVKTEYLLLFIRGLQFWKRLPKCLMKFVFPSQEKLDISIEGVCALHSPI